MTDRKCNHCDMDANLRRFAIGRKRLDICYSCAFELLRMQEAIKGWVE